MALDEKALHGARRARDRAHTLQRDAVQAQVFYQNAIRRLYASGGSMREIAEALGLSFQRVHQIVAVSTGKGALKSSEHVGSCSFCDAERSDVRTLIAGPGILICDRCVAIAVEVVADSREHTNERTLLAPVDPSESKLGCSFCGKRHEGVEAMVCAPRRSEYANRDAGVLICNECLELCEEILADGAGIEGP